MKPQIVEDVHALMERFKELGKLEAMCYIERGSILCQLKEGKKYLSLASHIRHWGDFLNEYHINRKTANNYMRIFRKFGEMTYACDISLVPLRRLLMLIPVKDEDVPRLLEDALVLPEKEFEDVVKGAKGEVQAIDCLHEDQEVIARCKKCGKWLK